MKALMLRSGWTTLEEVPIPRRGRRVDLLGIRGREMFGVEAKQTFNRTLQHQLRDMGNHCDVVAGIVATSPSAEKFEGAVAWSVGVFRLARDEVIQILAPNPQALRARVPIARLHQDLLTWCLQPGRRQSASAGSKMESGGGMAQRLLRGALKERL